MDKSKSEFAKKSPKPIDCSNCKYKCSTNFPQNIREKICESFWNLKDYRRQKDFILANVKSAAPKRRRPSNPSSEVKRTNSKTFFLCEKRVCQNFFLKTLSISNGPLIKAFQYKNEYTNFFDSEDRRGKHEPSNKIKPNVVNSIIEFLIQKCMAENDSKFRKKVICDTNFRSLRTLYNSFKSICHESCPSYTTFKRIFYENNFSLPQERLKMSRPVKPEEKIEIKSVEVVNFETAAMEASDEVIEDQAENPKVIVTPVPESAKYLSNQAEVYEIQFIHIPAINTL
jgi:hypothetical protein